MPRKSPLGSLVEKRALNFCPSNTTQHTMGRKWSIKLTRSSLSGQRRSSFVCCSRHLPLGDGLGNASFLRQRHVSSLNLGWRFVSFAFALWVVPAGFVYASFPASPV